MGSVRRIEFDELPLAVATALEPRVRRLGYLGEFFKCGAHQPEALAAFIAFTEESKKGLPANLVEIIGLTCAGWMGNQYERNQHERLCLRLGLTKRWVESVNRLKPHDAEGLNDEECFLQRLVLLILDCKGTGASDLFAEAVDKLGEKQAIAALMIIGRYVVHGLIVNTLALVPPVPSIFDEGDEA